VKTILFITLATLASVLTACGAGTGMKSLSPSLSSPLVLSTTTTTSTTSNCCREENTRARIWWSGTLAVSLKSLMQRARLLLRGMGPTKGARGIVSTEQKSPLTVVRRDYLSDDALVFNLTTSRTHTYYAGPALVHNCDGLQYACLQHDGGAAYGMAVTTARREIKPAPLAWARC
jgi:hypothetical protein